MEKYYRIAGLTVKMDCGGRTEKQAEIYRIPDCADFDMEIDADRLDKSAERLSHLSDDDKEYLLTGFVFYNRLLNHNGLMLHSSAVVVDENAYLFTADCGVGKSTHTELWLRLFEKKAYILNDDKPALRYETGKWYAYGTPWSGKNDISANKRVPLKGIAVIERSIENEILKFGGVEAITSVLKQVNRPVGRQLRVKLLELLDLLISNVPVWKLKCNTNISAAMLSYEAMSGHKYKEELF